MVSLSPSGPYTSGQLVTVTVPANSIVKPGSSLFVEECGAPPAGRGRWYHHCDPRTRQKVHQTVGPDGSAVDAGYPVYVLPDVALGESPRHRTQCDLDHPCVLAVGSDLDDPGHRLWSSPFLVVPPDGDPGTGTPEVPYALALPVLGGAIFGGWLVVRRRRAGSGPS